MQMQIEMKQKSQFDILKILTSCWLGWVVVSPFWQGDTGREMRWDEHLQTRDINTQLSSPTQKNDFLSAIRHINWWVRVLKMVETAYIVCMKFGCDEDNEGGVVCGALALAILTDLRFMSHQSGKRGAKDRAKI